MGMFLKQVAAEFRSPVIWVAWATVSLAVSIIGPFGSYGVMSASERALFWAPVVGISVLCGAVMRALVSGLGLLRGGLTGPVVIAALNSLVLAPALHEGMRLALPVSLDRVGNGFEIVLLIASISLGVCAFRQVAVPEWQRPQEMTGAAPQRGARLMPRLMRRLDPAVQGEVWALSVRDHYVDVLTSRGKTSLLMRLSDAMAEVEAVPGAQVHRSHWVAWAAVASVARDGAKTTLILCNGQEIPVSRNNRDKVDVRFAVESDHSPEVVKGAA